MKTPWWLSLMFGISIVIQHAGLNAESSKEVVAATTEIEPRVLLLEGAISRNMVRVVNSAVREANSEDSPTGLIVLLNSLGGDGLAAMKIGETLRKAKAHIFVTGQCASACVFVLAAGVVRGADAYTVGLHRGRVTVSRPDGSVKKELSGDQDAEIRAFLREFEGNATDYLSRMGMSPELFKTMQRFERHTVYRLNRSEMRRFGLVGVNPSYLAARTQHAPLGLTERQLSDSEFIRRVGRTSSRCGIYEKEASEFVKCYQENLLDPY